MNSSLLPLRSGVCCQGGGEEREKAKKRREPQNLSRGRGSPHSGSAQVISETGLIEGEGGEDGARRGEADGDHPGCWLAFSTSPLDDQ